MPSITTSEASEALVEVPPHTAPDLNHLLKHDSSVLALIVGPENIYTGTQDGEIAVWSLGTFQQLHRIQAHKRSVMCLFLSDDGNLLFSSASDPIVNVWCPRTMTRLYEIYSTWDCFGDIFSVAYSSQYKTVYYGDQNTAIQWVHLEDPERVVAPDTTTHPDRRNHRFFDSRAVGGGASTPRPTNDRYDLIPRSHTMLETDRRCIKQFAHYGYVYCMLMLHGMTGATEPDDDVLVSGAGDGTIKVWKLGGQEVGHNGFTNGIQELLCLGEDDGNCVMSLALDGSFLYGGKINGIIELWDLDTKQKLRSIKAHTGDVMTMQMGCGYLWSFGSNGTASKHSTAHYGEYQAYTSQNVNQKYQLLTQWQAHNGKILASAVISQQDKQILVTGANDNNVAVWSFEMPRATEVPESEVDEDVMLTNLRDFVSFKTISSQPDFAEDCRRGASFLRNLFRKLGGDVEMLTADMNLYHPVVFAKFGGKLEPAEKRKRILFYGHYDVVAAESKKGNWNTDPFQLQGTNGYLYGRGVSDNKGPIMAALYAVTDLVQAKALDADVVFLIEGEEESGSRGFQETVRRHKDRIGHIDYILLANSYWLNDETPCLTYGLRGVLHATVCVESARPDLHSGIGGSYMVTEAAADLMGLLTKIRGPRNRIMLPGFYDGVLTLTPEEEARYDDITTVLMAQAGEQRSAAEIKADLMARWREPSITIHDLKVSGPEGSLISSHASSHISFRLVPGQEVDQVIESLKAYLEKEFALMETDNTLNVRIDNMADPWLGDPDNEIFRALEEATMQAWAPLFASDDAGAETAGNTADKGEKPRKPLYIREGGSIPAIRFLEKEFEAPAAHLPCGQSSDAAHLDNERLRMANLFKSREIFGSVFKKL